jgi:hypothetical protein
MASAHTYEHITRGARPFQWNGHDGAGFPGLVWEPLGEPKAQVLCIHGLSGAAADFGPLGRQLAAQGFTGASRPQTVTWAHMAPMIRRLNLLQIDSVNVLVRSHYLPLFSRLGAYRHASLDERSFGQKKRALFECWAHEASLLPLDLHPLMRWRMAQARLRCSWLQRCCCLLRPQQRQRRCQSLSCSQSQRGCLGCWQRRLGHCCCCHSC